MQRCASACPVCPIAPKAMGQVQGVPLVGLSRVPSHTRPRMYAPEQMRAGAQRVFPTTPLYIDFRYQWDMRHFYINQ